MQIKSLRIKSYRSWRIDDKASPEAMERLEKLERHDKLRQAGCPPDLALEVTGWSRATFYRWRKRHLVHGTRGLETPMAYCQQLMQAA